MGRNTTNELRLKWFYCKDYTQSISPVIIKKEKVNRFHMSYIYSM